MQTFTGAEYLMIDAANAFGLDKEVFPKRIAWVKNNFNNLESFTQEADEPLLYLKAVQTIRAVQNGESTGHLVELDATTSGIQFMSALVGCPTGAKWTNLVDPSKRYDAYSESFSAMKTMLSKLARLVKEITRGMAKDALMTAFYGSSAEPEKVFGRDTTELDAFYMMCEKRLKGCWELRNDLIELWNPYADDHSWTLPDGYYAYVPTSVKKKIECEIDELDGHKFTHTYESFEGTEQGVALAANVIHSIDGYMVRELSRRTNYKQSEVLSTMDKLGDEVIKRNLSFYTTDLDLSMPASAKWFDVDPTKLSDDMVIRLYNLAKTMGNFEPTEVVCIHDAFKAHPNHCNTIRYWYKEILAELAESDLLSHIFTEIAGEEVEYENVKTGYTKQEMAALIRQSEYAIC